MNDDRAGFGIDNADLQQVPVRARADEHRETLVVRLEHVDRVAQGVKHVRVGDTMLPRAVCDGWIHTQASYLVTVSLAS